MGSIVVTLELAVVTLLLPETLKPEYKTAGGLWSFAKQNWHLFGTPWNNVRVFATTELRGLMSIRLIHYIIGGGGTALFLTWYRRHQPDTFTMYSLGAAAGVTTFGSLFFVSRLVDRYGDLRGIWAPSNAITILFGLGIALVPSHLFWLCFPVLALSGFGGALTGFTPELLAKLIPPDIQGTFQTAKAFIYDVQKAITMWPWVGLFVISEGYSYPMDALTIWVALGLGMLALALTLKMFAHDPKEAIVEGKALDAYWKTPYVLKAVNGRSSWYRRHGGRVVLNEAMGPVERLRSSEGISKVGLFLTEPEDASLPAYVNFLGQNLPTTRSLSVVFCFMDSEDVLGPTWGTSKSSNDFGHIESSSAVATAQEAAEKTVDISSCKEMLPPLSDVSSSKEQHVAEAADDSRTTVLAI
jgi:hypothetical protein